MTQSYTLAECREAWQCVIPMDLQRHFRHGDQMVVNELILAHMLGLISSSAAASLEHSISATFGLMFLPVLTAGVNSDFLPDSPSN